MKRSGIATVLILLGMGMLTAVAYLLKVPVSAPMAAPSATFPVQRTNTGSAQIAVEQTVPPAGRFHWRKVESADYK